jgi:mannose-6-phosphate isomerase-like protein (cupin superfamily)
VVPVVLVHERPDAATDDVGWNESIEGETIGSQVSVIMVYSTREGAGPRLHRHPYTETFVVRRGRALFTVGDERLEAVGGQVLVVPAFTPHKFASIGSDPFVSTNIHANPTFETDWLE